MVSTQRSLTASSAAYRSSTSDQLGPSDGHHQSASNTREYQSFSAWTSAPRWMTWYMSPKPYGLVFWMRRPTALRRDAEPLGEVVAHDALDVVVVEVRQLRVGVLLGVRETLAVREVGPEHQR